MKITDSTPTLSEVYLLGSFLMLLPAAVQSLFSDVISVLAFSAWDQGVKPDLADLNPYSLVSFERIPFVDYA